MILEEEDRMRAEWLRPTEDAVVHEIPRGILNDLIIDYADVIVVFKLGDIAQYSYDQRETEAPGSTAELRVYDRMKENNKLRKARRYGGRNRGMSPVLSNVIR